jgi:hypothetical protein
MTATYERISDQVTVDPRMFWAIAVFMFYDLLYFLLITGCLDRQLHNYVIKQTSFIKMGLILFDLRKQTPVIPMLVL